MKTPTALSVTSPQREQTSLRFQVPRLPRSNVLNARPRKSLGFRSPQEVFHSLAYS
jgi:IS30 family transposase